MYAAAFNAANMSDFETLKSLLESEIRDELFSFVDDTNSNVLHKAVISNNVECVRLLVDEYPSLTEQGNDYQDTPLHLACYYKADLNIIKILCECKKTLNMRNYQHNTPLFQAFVHTNECFKYEDGYISELIKILIENGADVNAKGCCNGYTILHQAVACNKLQEFKLLLNYGLKINTTNNKGRTVLHVAALDNRCEFVKFIIEKEPKLVLILDKNLISPLSFASRYSCENCIEILIKNNADVLQKSFEGSCIELAVQSGKVKNVAKLLEYGADPMIYSQMPPFLYACHENYVEILELLLNHESINEYVLDKKIPRNNTLQYVVENNINPKILKLILNHPQFKDKIDKSVIYKLNPFFICFSGLIGLFLCSNFSRAIFSSDSCDVMLQCLEILLQEKFPLNHTNGALSALTSLLLTYSTPCHQTKLLEVAHKLIQHGCEVYDMSISNGTFEGLSIEPIDFDIRNELQVPDVLVIAFLTRNVIATNYFLRYWPQPPILLLLLYPTKSFNTLNQWFEILIEFGWPTANKYVKQIEELMNGENEENKIVPLNQNPSSLQCLAKFAARSYLFERKSEVGMSLSTLIESLDIPSTLTDELLFVSHNKVVEIKQSDDEDRSEFVNDSDGDFDDSKDDSMEVE